MLENGLTLTKSVKSDLLPCNLNNFLPMLLCLANAIKSRTSIFARHSCKRKEIATMLLAQLYVPFTIKFQSLIDTFSHPIVLLKQLFVLLLVLNYKQEKILCFLAWFKCLPFLGVLKNQNGEVTSKRLRFQEWNTWLARPRLVFKAISSSVNYSNFDGEKWNYFTKDIAEIFSTAILNVMNQQETSRADW